MGYMYQLFSLYNWDNKQSRMCVYSLKTLTWK